MYFTSEVHHFGRSLLQILGLYAPLASIVDHLLVCADKDTALDTSLVVFKPSGRGHRFVMLNFINQSNQAFVIETFSSLCFFLRFDKERIQVGVMCGCLSESFSDKSGLIELDCESQM